MYRYRPSDADCTFTCYTSFSETGSDDQVTVRVEEEISHVTQNTEPWRYKHYLCSEEAIAERYIWPALSQM
jgi:hypothetical protein